MTANLPMGGNKVTGAADPTVSTDLATKNYIDTLVASFFSTGDAKLTLKITPDTSWVMCDDGTIGSATSGASNRANADTQALFTLLFNNISDTYAPILTSGGGATTRAAQVSASAAWAANCRISLTKVLGRALGVSGAGSGLTLRSIGQFIGSETNTIASNNLPNTALSASVTGTVTVRSSSSSVVTGAITVNSNLTAGGGSFFSTINSGTGASSQIVSADTNTLSGATASMNGGVTQQPFGIVSPISYFNCMIKL